MGRQVAVEWAESGEELRERFAGDRDAAWRARLQALWLVREGRGLAEASRDVGVGRRSLERWLGWYREGGLAEVLWRVPGHGGPADGGATAGAGRAGGCRGVPDLRRGASVGRLVGQLPRLLPMGR